MIWTTYIYRQSPSSHCFSSLVRSIQPQKIPRIFATKFIDIPIPHHTLCLTRLRSCPYNKSKSLLPPKHGSFSCYPHEITRVMLSTKLFATPWDYPISITTSHGNSYAPIYLTMVKTDRSEMQWIKNSGLSPGVFCDGQDALVVHVKIHVVVSKTRCSTIYMSILSEDDLRQRNQGW